MRDLVDMQDLRKGDRVRLAYEVDVLEAPNDNLGSVKVRADGFSEVRLTRQMVDEAGVQIELVRREPVFNVGDLVLYGSEYASDRAEAVVVATHPEVHGAQFGGPGRPYRVWVEEDQDWYMARHDEVFPRPQV